CSLITTALFSVSNQAFAFGFRRDCCEASCAPAMQIQWVEKKVTCYRPQWQEGEVTCTINRPIPREVVTPVKCGVLVPERTQVKRTMVVCGAVPKEIERDVPVCRMVAECVTDPCTGCTRTVCRPVTTMQRVRCTVMQSVPEQKEITVPVCNWKPVEQTREVRRIVCDWKPETVTRKVSYCTMVPYETTVRVPVCVPVACN